MSDWIKVREQKPNDGDRVIFFNFIEDEVMCGYYNCLGFFSYNEIDGCVIGYHDDCVTHWMTYPKSPVLSKDEECRFMGFDSESDMYKKIFGDDFDESKI